MKSVSVGLLRIEVGLFRTEVGLLWTEVGLFWTEVGLLLRRFTRARTAPLPNTCVSNTNDDEFILKMTSFY